MERIWNQNKTAMSFTSHFHLMSRIGCLGCGLRSECVSCGNLITHKLWIPHFAGMTTSHFRLCLRHPALCLADAGCFCLIRQGEQRTTPTGDQTNAQPNRACGLGLSSLFQPLLPDIAGLPFCSPLLLLRIPGVASRCVLSPHFLLPARPSGLAPPFLIKLDLHLQYRLPCLCNSTLSGSRWMV